MPPKSKQQTKRNRFQYTMDREGFRSKPYIDALGVATSGYGFTKNMETIKNAHTRNYTEKEAIEVLEKEMDHRLKQAYKNLDPRVVNVIRNNPQLEAMYADALWQSPYGYGGKNAKLTQALNDINLFQKNPDKYFQSVAGSFNRGNYYTNKKGERVKLTSVYNRNRDRGNAFMEYGKSLNTKKLIKDVYTKQESKNEEAGILDFLPNTNVSQRQTSPGAVFSNNTTNSKQPGLFGPSMNILDMYKQMFQNRIPPGYSPTGQGPIDYNRAQ